MKHDGEELLNDLQTRFADPDYLVPGESVDGICRNLEDYAAKCKAFQTDEMNTLARRLESYIDDVRKRSEWVE